MFSELLLNRLKDGLPAAEKCARYMVKDYSLIIKDVAEEDAGNYTIILSIRQWNLSKNHTVTLRVNGKFTAQFPVLLLSIYIYIYATFSLSWVFIDPEQFRTL